MDAIWYQLASTSVQRMSIDKIPTSSLMSHHRFSICGVFYLLRRFLLSASQCQRARIGGLCSGSGSAA